MKVEKFDLAIIGGGPAGMAAAVAAKKNGVDSIIILERDNELGGILNQCIHNGFGLHTFGEELTGPEYAERYADQVRELGIEYRLSTMVMNLTANREIVCMNKDEGMYEIQAKSIILAMGCRERPRGALNVPGYRPSGIFSAGTAQRMVNMEGYMPGKEAVFLGSGDIGLIMARRLTLEGAKVHCVLNRSPKIRGLRRNIVQCLDDYGIPLRIGHTIVDVEGKERLTGVVVAKVDENLKPIPGTEEHYNCDCLLLSVGLIPENELSMKAGIELDPRSNGAIVDENLQTSVPGIFSCGNVLHVHDLVDNVSKESDKAGKNAAAFITGNAGVK